MRVAAPPPAVGNAAFPRTEPPATLRSGRQVEPYRTVERRHLDARAEHRLVHRDRDRAEHVVTVAAKECVGRDLNRHVEIACRAAMPACIARLRDAQPRTVANTCRYPHRRRPRFGPLARVPCTRRRRPSAAGPCRRTPRSPSQRPCARGPSGSGRDPRSSGIVLRPSRLSPVPRHAPQGTWRVTTTCRSSPVNCTSNGTASVA